MAGWSWAQLVRLNRCICQAAGYKPGLRFDVSDFDKKQKAWLKHGWIARTRPFLNCNQRTSAALAVIEALDHE